MKKMLGFYILFLIVLVSKAFAGYTDNLCSGGTASASSVIGGYSAAKAFDGSEADEDRWGSQSADTQWLQYHFASAQKINKIRILPRSMETNRAPGDFTFSGSNTGAFSGEQALLLTVSGSTYSSGVYNEWTFSNDNSYLYYRINITGKEGSFGVSEEYNLVEMQMMQELPREGNDEYTVFLLHSNTTNGSQVFVDSSASGNGGSGHNITLEGDVHHNTGESKFGASSIWFDGGTGDNLQLALNHADFNFGANPFTVDFWVYTPSNTGSGSVGGQWDGGNTNEMLIYAWKNTWTIQLGSTGQINFAVSNGAWHHIAVVGDGATIKVAVDGVFDADTCAQIDIAFDQTKGFSIGSYYSGTYTYTGYIDEYRVSKGIARWTTDFTPPTEAYPEAAAPEPSGGELGPGTVAIASGGKGLKIKSGGRFVVRQ